MGKYPLMADSVDAKHPGLTDRLSLVLNLNPRFARLVLLGFAALLTVLISLLFQAPLRTFEDQVGALGWTLQPDTLIEERVSVVAIDEKSLAELGPWPWSRDTMTRLSDALQSYNVQMQLYDIVFPEARPGDAGFVQALLANNAVLSQVPVLTGEQLIQTGVPSHPLSGLACNDSYNIARGFVANAAGFAGVPAGHITPLVAADGGVRQVPAFICMDNQAYPALALSALLNITGSADWAVALTPGNTMLAPTRQLTLDSYPGLSVPLDAAGNLRVSFRKAPETFQAFSAVDVINGTIDRTLLENTWVLVGYTAFGLVDIVPTPYSGAAPGVEIQARIITSILDEQVPYQPRAALWIQLAAGLVFAGILMVLSASKRDKLAGYSLALAVVVFPILAITLHIQILRHTNLWLGWTPSALFGLLAAGILMVHEFSRVKRERNRVLFNLSSYLPLNVAEEIAYSLPNSSIQARRQSVTLLSADLRNFPAYGESRLPEESAALLHFFFVKANAIVEAHQGRVHEFKGDGLIAMWDDDSATAAGKAYAAARAMQHEIQESLPARAPAGLEPLALGIGIEQGPVLIGSIGPAQRRSHTLLGETVTIALRIQDMTAELAQPILIGEKAAAKLTDQTLESQGSYLLSGLRTPHKLYAPPVNWASGKPGQPALKLHLGGKS